MPEPADAELVAAIRGGDTAAWGLVFDRHRDAVWRVGLAITRRPQEAEEVLSVTFLKGVESIAGLTDPERLRPWLLAIARRVALDRVRPSRRREDPSDTLGELGDTGETPDLLRDVSRAEIARLVDDAMEGLAPRDRAALELADGQGATGEELAQALGLSLSNAYALVANARERFAGAVGSLVVARVGRTECSELRGLLRDWDGRLSPLLRKRLVRHVRACETCSAIRDREASPSALLGVVPLALPSIAVLARARDATVAAAGSAGATGVTGVAATAGVKLGLWAAAGLVLVSAGVGSVLLRQHGSSTTAPAAAASLAEDAPPSTSATSEHPTSTTDPGSAVLTTEPPTEAEVSTQGGEVCRLVMDLRAFSGPGPMSGSEVDLVAYLRGTNDRLQLLVTALEDPSAEIAAYAAAYQQLAGNGTTGLGDIAADEALAALAATVEAQLDARCPQ